jgi:GalNAc-alpha-(1->4)-GalNAc-alpha-(1->3)-diNAcBac-PP-undecaprenol alpha-1,4-N-acetyl-D-galactosaminyltransferase
MKIALVIHSLGIGGMERVMAHLIQEFSTYENVVIHVILIGNKREIKYDLPTTAIIHKPEWEFNNTKRFRHTLKTIVYIRKTLKQINPNSILSFGEMWNNLVLIASLGLHLTIYVSDRSIPGKNLGKLQNLLRNKLYPLAKGFIAQTEKSEKIAKKYKWNNNIQVIGNPIPAFTFSTNNTRKQNVLMVSRLIKTKKVDRLIDIFASVNHTKSWKLVVVGGNAKKMNLLEEYRQDVQDKKLENEVYLMGEQNNVHTFYAESEIFAFTSVSEGFPNALAEAMSAGCACIAYDCLAGPSDIIDNGVNGFLIPENDEKLFAEKLSILMQDTNLREQFRLAAKEKMKIFDGKIIAHKFYQFITQNINPS